METLKKYNVICINEKELVSISGGDRITQGFFALLGRIFGSIVAAGEAEEEPGLHSHGYNR